MNKYTDYTGEVFGRLTCVQKDGVDNQGRTMWLCKCQCGNEVRIMWHSFASGSTKSCGCLHKDITAASKRTHSLSVNENGRTPRLYSIWRNMKQRCFNPKAAKYSIYGGQGITVCEEWLEYINFHEWAMSNGYKDDLTLDRVCGNENYSPANCRWATYSKQNSNKKDNRFIEYEGETKTLNDWSIQLGMQYGTLHSRLSDYGWSVEKAFNTPVGKRRKL